MLDAVRAAVQKPLGMAISSSRGYQRFSAHAEPRLSTLLTASRLPCWVRFLRSSPKPRWLQLGHVTTGRSTLTYQQYRFRSEQAHFRELASPSSG